MTKSVDSPDMSRFASRLHYHGRLVFDSAHRIGAERSMAVDAPDLPVLRTEDGRPYIPGSSFKGAWRSYTESVLRTIEAQVGATNLACIITIEEERCLPVKRVRELKSNSKRTAAEIDSDIRQASCWACRVFGNLWLASKVLVKDLMIDESRFRRTELRDGVGIDRDSGRAGDGLKYQFEAVPVGAEFGLEILVENASPAELGVAMLGLKAFERGEVPLGGAKSRGLGWCHIEPAWEKSRYVRPDNLLDYLLGAEQQAAVHDGDAGQWLQAFRQAITQEAVV
jgi:CRISPR-associated protein Csm3